MKEAFEKILERLSNIYRVVNTNEDEEWNRAIYKSTKIVQEVAEEYKGDMKHNLAEMYAKNMVDYGVDVTKAWQTATQQSCALEKAYIRGRQYEADRFNELRKEYNNGWIACSERLPDIEADVLLTLRSLDIYTGFRANTDGYFYVEGTDDGYIPFDNVIAWQPLPEPYQPKGE